MITLTLDTLTEFQQSYDSYINILIARVAQLKPIEWVDVYNIMNISRDLKLISSDLNNQYKKYIVKYTKKLNSLQNSKVSIYSDSIVNNINQMTDLKKEMSAGILHRDYKSLLESYNDIINAIQNSITTHKTLNIKHVSNIPTKTILTPTDVLDLTKSISTLKQTIDLLIDNMSTPNNIGNNVIDNPNLETADIIMDDNVSDEELEWDEIVQMSDVETPDLKAQYFKIEDLLQQIANGTLETPINVTNIDAIIKRIDDLESTINIKLSMLPTQQPLTYVESDHNRNIIKINDNLRDMKTKISQIYNNTEVLANTIETISNKSLSDKNTLKQLKDSLNANFESNFNKMIEDFSTVINNMNSVKTDDMLIMQEEIIRRILETIETSLINEENIIRVLNEPFKKFEAQNIKSVMDVIQLVSKEFNDYINTLKDDLTLNISTNKAHQDQIAKLIQHQESLFSVHKNELSDILQLQNSTVSELNTKMEQELLKYHTELENQKILQDQRTFMFENFLKDTIPPMVSSSINVVIKEETKPIKDLYEDMKKMYTTFTEHKNQTIESIKHYENTLRQFEEKSTILMNKIKEDEDKITKLKEDMLKNKINIKKQFKTQTDTIKQLNIETMQKSEESFKSLIAESYSELKTLIDEIISGKKDAFNKIPTILKKIQAQENNTRSITMETNKLLKKEKDKIKHIENELMQLIHKIDDMSQLNTKYISELANINEMISEYASPTMPSKKRKLI